MLSVFLNSTRNKISRILYLNNDINNHATMVDDKVHRSITQGNWVYKDSCELRCKSQYNYLMQNKLIIPHSTCPTTTKKKQNCRWGCTSARIAVKAKYRILLWCSNKWDKETQKSSMFITTCHSCVTSNAYSHVNHSYSITFPYVRKWVNGLSTRASQ